MCVGSAWRVERANDVWVAVGIDDTRRDEAAVEPRRRRGGGVRTARAAARHAGAQVVGAPLRDERGRLARLGGLERLGGRGQAVRRILPHALGVSPLPPRTPLGLCRKAHGLALDDNILSRRDTVCG